MKKDVFNSTLAWLIKGEFFPRPRSIPLCCSHFCWLR